MTPLRTTLQLGLVLFALMALASGVRQRVMNQHVAGSGYEDVYYVPPPEWLPVFSLGWDSALADLLWTRALVYFGEEMRHRGSMQHVFSYANAMLALDPDFREVYSWIATAGLYHPRAIGPDEARRTIDFLRRGVDRFPTDGELIWTLGAALAFELPPLLDDERESDAARAEGAEYLMRAARLGAGPDWIALTGASLLSRIGRASAAAEHLEEMYALTDDVGTRAQIADAIARLRTSAHAEAMVESARAEQERRLTEMPYAPPDLYFLVGPVPVVEWRQAYREGFGHDALTSEREARRDLADLDGPDPR